MLNAKEIQNKQFEKTRIGGYKPEDVDVFFAQVAADYAQLQKDKSELERKLEVLADKIREYREDEDALKDALLIAQKQGNAIVAESKAAAEKLEKETNEKVEKLLKESKIKSERLVNDANEYSKKTRAEADAAGEKTIQDANDKAAEIKAAMDRQQAIQEEILQRTRKEVLEYRTKILAAYKAQIELIEQMPEQCENEFVKKTIAEAEKRSEEKKKAEEAKRKAEEAKRLEEQKAAKAKAEAEKKAKDKAAAEAKAAKAAPKPAAPKQAAPAPAPAPKPAPENKPAAGAQKPAEPAGTTPDRTAENRLPFFNSDSQPVTKHTDLQFGKNNDKK